MTETKTHASNIPMTAHLQDFMAWSASMNYAQTTIITRQRAIQRFIDWCEPRNLVDPVDIRLKNLEKYRDYLFNYRKANGEPLSMSTQHCNLAPLKAYFKWLYQQNRILFNPASDFQLPKLPKRLPKDILSQDEIAAILAHTRVYGDIGIRDRAIFETFYSTGIRRMELVNLKIHDVDLARKTITVFEGKGKQDRVVPIGKRACQWVHKYREDIRPTLVNSEDEGVLFLTEKGKPFSNNRMGDLVNKYKKATGLEKRGACHLFRHSMATHMHDNGAGIRHIQQILGHVNLTSTQIYTKVSIKQLQEVHRATHPSE